MGKNLLKSVSFEIVGGTGWWCTESHHKLGYDDKQTIPVGICGHQSRQLNDSRLREKFREKMHREMTEDDDFDLPIDPILYDDFYDNTVYSSATYTFGTKTGTIFDQIDADWINVWNEFRTCYKQI